LLGARSRWPALEVSALLPEAARDR